MILFCGCQGLAGNYQGTQYQDAIYGTGHRVHTKLLTPKDSPPKFRCTICSTERGKPGPVESAKSKKPSKKSEEQLGKRRS